MNMSIEFAPYARIHALGMLSVGAKTAIDLANPILDLWLKPGRTKCVGIRMGMCVDMCMDMR